MFLHIHSIAWWPTLFALAIAVFTDLRSRRIPNWLVGPFLLTGPVVLFIFRGWAGLGQSVLGMLLAVCALGVFYCLGGMGMGDVKLYAAIGAWIGPSQLATALVITGLAGGVLAICWAVAHGFLRQSLSGVRDLILGFGRRGFRPHSSLVLANPAARKMPYAPAIAIGAILSFLGGGA